MVDNKNTEEIISDELLFNSDDKNVVELGSGGRRVDKRRSHHRSESSKKSSKKREKSNRSRSSKKFRIGMAGLSIWLALLTVAMCMVYAVITDINGNIKVLSEAVNKQNEPIIVGDGSGDSYVVPEYWQDSVNEAIGKVNSLLDEAGRDAVVFAWFSDLHYSKVAKNTATGIITSAVMNECNIPFAVTTGDVLTQSPLQSEAEVRDAYKAVYKMLAPIGADRLLQVEGNHDGSFGQIDYNNDGEYGDGESYCYNFTDEQLYNSMFRQHSGDTRRVYGDEGTWFYIDDTVSKTRYIMLNTVWDEYSENDDGTAKNNQMSDHGFGQKQLSWLANEALSFEEDGWSVLLFGHVPVTQTALRDGKIALGILEAYQSASVYEGVYGNEGEWDHVDISVDFTDKYEGEIIGYYCGHIHKDSITRSASFPVVSITANSNIPYDENEEKREYGTDNEVAVDFVVINKRTGEVNHVRLGVGEDREYKY